MNLQKFLAELRHRGVFKVAAAYLASAVVVLEVGTHLFHNFEAPHWVLKVFTSLLILGFPIACLMGWGFEFTPDGVRPVPAHAEKGPATSKRSDRWLAALLVLLLGVLVASVVKDWRGAKGERAASATVVADSADASAGPDAPPADRPAAGTARRIPVVVILDTPAPRGVYEQGTREKAGTNADDLNDVLRDLPVTIQKETIGATWEREEQILRQRPDLVMIHRSGFFHAMNQEFGFGYPDDSAGFDEARAKWLYEIADNKLVAVLGFIGQSSPGTAFVVYSRGTGGDWNDDQYRADWVRNAEGRFPTLKGRVTTILVPGGPGAGSFEDAATRELFRQRVRGVLELSEGGPT